jgi:hypothetical protein
MRNNIDGCLIGHSCYIAEVADKGITGIAHIIEAAKGQFNSIQLSTFTVFGKRLPSLEPQYLFRIFSQHQRSIFIAPEAVASKYITSTEVSVIQQDDSITSSIIAIAHTAIVPGRKRRLSNKHAIVTTKESTTDKTVQIFAVREDGKSNKRQILQLKWRPTQPENTVVFSEQSAHQDNRASELSEY